MAGTHSCGLHTTLCNACRSPATWLTLGLIVVMEQEKELARLHEALEVIEGVNCADESDFDYFPVPQLGLPDTCDGSAPRNPTVDSTGKLPHKSLPIAQSQDTEVIDVNPKAGDASRKGRFIYIETITTETVHHQAPSAWPQPKATTPLQAQQVRPCEQRPMASTSIPSAIPSSTCANLHASSSARELDWLQQTRDSKEATLVSSPEKTAPALQLWPEHTTPMPVLASKPVTTAHANNRFPRPPAADPRVDFETRPPFSKASGADVVSNQEHKARGNSLGPGRLGTDEQAFGTLNWLSNGTSTDTSRPLQSGNARWRLPRSLQTGASLQSENDTLRLQQQQDPLKGLPTPLQPCSTNNHATLGRPEERDLPSREEFFGMGRSFGIGAHQQPYRWQNPLAPEAVNQVAELRTMKAPSRGRKRPSKHPIPTCFILLHVPVQRV